LRGFFYFILVSNEDVLVSSLRLNPGKLFQQLSYYFSYTAIRHLYMQQCRHCWCNICHISFAVRFSGFNAPSKKQTGNMCIIRIP